MGSLAAATLCRPAILSAALLAGLSAVTPLRPARAAQPPDLGKGRLLIASEKLLDPNFVHTVVLLIEYGEGGTLGLVLNRPSGMSLDQALPELEGAARVEEPLYVGGPVAIEQVTMLFTTGESHGEQIRVLGTVHAGWDRELLQRMVAKPAARERFRLFAGHAGWAPGQLEAEIEQGAWHIFQATEAIVFDTRSEALWLEFIEHAKTRVMALVRDSVRPPPERGP